MIRFGKISILHSQKAFNLFRLWASVGKHPTTHALKARQSSLQ